MGVFDASTSPPKERYAVTDDTVYQAHTTRVVRGPADRGAAQRGAGPCWQQAARGRGDSLPGGATPISRTGTRTAVLASCVTAMLPGREILTGLGPLAVRQPRVRDRGAASGDPERIRFRSALLPPYARRTKSLDVLLPILYLRGLSTGDFQEALAALLGKDAPGLSASTISRLKETWSDEHQRWRKRDLSARRYVYVWADGIFDWLNGAHGGVDFLINNAGRSIRRAIEASYERFHDYERTMQLNYFGSLRVTMGLLPGMVARQKKGHVVNVSSIGVLTNAPRFSADVAVQGGAGCVDEVRLERVRRPGRSASRPINMPLVRTPMIARPSSTTTCPPLARRRRQT